ncbi:MAG: hypothetical protein AAB289_00405, partial [Chloroflexota bacterium]
LKNPLVWVGMAVLAFAGLVTFYPTAGADDSTAAATGPSSNSCCCRERHATAPAACACAAQGLDCPSKRGNTTVVQKKTEDMKDMPMPSAEAMAKGKAARKAVQEHQKGLQADGTYSCCIKPGCTFCSTAADMCPCAKMLAKGMPVCPECWGGWQAGAGRLEGVQADKVKIIPHDKLKMMYMMRAKNFAKAGEK